MKTWNYQRALRWLSIDPKNRKLNSSSSSAIKWVEWTLNDLIYAMRGGDHEPFSFEPPTDPVPLAEVLYELVSGEEEEFLVEGDIFTRIRWNKTSSSFQFYHPATSEWLTTDTYWRVKSCLFHRIAEPGEKKREPRERWFLISDDGRFINSFAKKEDAEEMGRAFSSLYESSKHEVVKFREVVE